MRKYMLCMHTRTKPKLTAHAIWYKGIHRQWFDVRDHCADCGCLVGGKG